MKYKKNTKRLIILAVFLITIGWVYVTNTQITTTHIGINNDKISSDLNGFKIAHISDLHNKDWDKQLINKLKKEDPQIIVITGDLIDSSHTDFPMSLEFINESKKIAPIYYVAGNHEAWSGQYDDLRSLLLDEGVLVLDDAAQVLKYKNSELLLIGLQDPDFNQEGAAKYEVAGVLETKLNDLVSDYAGYKILLSHRPEFFESYANSNIDLVFSGHAHGGQFRIPFLGGLVAPNQGFFPDYSSGLYFQNQTSMIVSRGLGNSIIPIRINNTPELVIAELNSNK